LFSCSGVFSFLLFHLHLLVLAVSSSSSRSCCFVLFSCSGIFSFLLFHLVLLPGILMLLYCFSSYALAIWCDIRYETNLLRLTHPRSYARSSHPAQPKILIWHGHLRSSTIPVGSSPEGGRQRSRAGTTEAPWPQVGGHPLLVGQTYICSI
jgi:hypothetical protein